MEKKASFYTRMRSYFGVIKKKGYFFNITFSFTGQMIWLISGNWLLRARCSGYHNRYRIA